MPSGHAFLNVVPLCAGIAILCGVSTAIVHDAASDWWIAALCVLAAWLGLGLFCAGLALVFDLPGLYGKRADGTLPAYVWVHLGSWLLLYRGSWLFGKPAMRACGLGKKNDREFDLVAPRLILGRLLWQLPDAKSLGAPEVGMVVDLTCEWSEPSPLRSVECYLSVPVVDTTRPSTEQLLLAARDMMAFLSDPDAGSVYVHCANGYGRSAVACAALLLLDGTCDTAEEARDILRNARPVVSLRGAENRSFCQGATHMEALEELLSDLSEESLSASASDGSC